MSAILVVQLLDCLQYHINIFPLRLRRSSLYHDGQSSVMWVSWMGVRVYSGGGGGGRGR